MNRFFAWSLLLGLMGGALAARCPADQGTNSAPVPPAPRIVFDSTDLDLGTLTNINTIAGIFTFQNTGNAVLHIKLLYMGSFSGGFPAFGPIEPGQKGEIPFHLQLGQAKVKITKNLTIKTDDPRNPVIPVMFDINVLSEPIGSAKAVAP